MPTILVISNARAEQDSTIALAEERGSTVTLAEAVEPEQLASDHLAAQLVERVGWALIEAKDCERTPEPSPESDRETARVDPRRVEEEVYEKLYGKRIGCSRVASAR